MNKSMEFLQNICGVWERRIPDAVLARARQSLLDYLAVTMAGARFQKEKLQSYMAFAQPEEGRFTALGTGRRLALKEAVFLNGLNGHALDFDDGTNSGIIHLGSPIFSLLLPLAQRYEIGIQELLRAAVTVMKHRIPWRFPYSRDTRRWAITQPERAGCWAQPQRHPICWDSARRSGFQHLPRRVHLRQAC